MGSSNYLGMRAFRYNDSNTGERVVFYRHPNGQKIKREVRDWNAYGVLGGQAGMVIDPKVSWVVYDGRRSVESFRTLHAAKAWCDEHKKIRQIPIYRRPSGASHERGVLIAHAVVDEEDWYRFGGFRWRLASGYAVSTASKRNPVGPELGRTYFLHRLILGLDLEDGRYTDHINRDRLDCRRVNLRIVTRSQNNQNQTPRKGGTSRYRGVNFHPYSGLWAVRVRVNGKTLSGGYFKDEDEAGAAAARLRAEHMPYAV